jgi:hypothetical protein
MRSTTAILIALILNFTRLFSQVGGDNTYEFLNLSTNALVTSLGGVNVSLPGNDPSLSFYNPALLYGSTKNNFALNYVNYFAGINYGSATWTGDNQKLGRFAVGIIYLNYGSFEEADPAGVITGEFRAAEYAMNLTWNMHIDTLFNAGITFKPVLSQLEGYSSFGVAFDIGMTYSSLNGIINAGLVVSNIGFQVTRYTDKRDRLPTSVTAGITASPEHAPFRISLTAHHLTRYDMTNSYTEEDQDNYNDNSGIAKFGENIMRHLVFGAEFIPSPNFFISAGFNYQRRKELAVDYRSSTVGFSTGFGLRLAAFDLTYSRSRFHLAGSVNNVTLMVKPGAFFKRN